MTKLMMMFRCLDPFQVSSSCSHYCLGGGRVHRYERILECCKHALGAGPNIEVCTCAEACRAETCDLEAAEIMRGVIKSEEKEGRLPYSQQPYGPLPMATEVHEIMSKAMAAEEDRKIMGSRVPCKFHSVGSCPSKEERVKCIGCRCYAAEWDAYEDAYCLSPDHRHATREEEAICSLRFQLSQAREECGSLSDELKRHREVLSHNEDLFRICPKCGTKIVEKVCCPDCGSALDPVLAKAQAECSALADELKRHDEVLSHNAGLFLRLRKILDVPIRASIEEQAGKVMRENILLRNRVQVVPDMLALRARFKVPDGQSLAGWIEQHVRPWDKGCPPWCRSRTGKGRDDYCPMCDMAMQNAKEEP